MCALDNNCRKPLSQIAHELRIGRNVIGYRVKNLEKEGIISKYICSINLGKLGYKTYKIYFKIQSANQSSAKEFSNFLINNDSVIHCIKTEGSFDYSVAIAVKTILALDNFLNEIKTKFGEIIKDYFVSIIIYTKVFKLNKLLLNIKEKMIKSEKYSGEEETYRIDEKDKKIIRVLAQRSNLSLLDIAEKTNLTVDIVKYRLKKLSENIITSYRPVFNLSKFGYYHYVLMLKMRHSGEKTEKDLLSWCTNKENVLYCTKRIGHFDFEVNIAINNIENLNSFIEEFKKRFAIFIDSYELIINRELLKLNYVPF